MFSCPCSLRSTQCAALIALAAVAGIPRFEPAPARAADPAPTPTSTPRLEISAALPRAHRFSFPSLLDLPSRAWGRGAPAAFFSALDERTLTPTPVVLQPSSEWPPAPPAAEAPGNFFTRATPAPTVRQHAHPFAVGPPRRETIPNLRAIGTAVPGDSLARWKLSSRIASHGNCFARAPRTCGADSSSGSRPARRTGRPAGQTNGHHPMAFCARRSGGFFLP